MPAFLRFSVVVSTCLFALSTVLASPAFGATLYVSKPGNDFGNCTATDPCATISHAVYLADAGDTIEVGFGTFGEISGITIEESITIRGEGSLFGTVVRQLSEGYPVFTILNEATVTLQAIMITQGSGIGAGGIDNRGTLTLNDVRVFKNRAASGSAIVSGAAATLTMVRVGLEHNDAREGLMNWGTAIVVESWITGSTNIGVANAGTLLMVRSLIAHNGIGIANYPNSPPAATGLANVTISGNATGINANGGQMLLRYATVAANQTGFLLTHGSLSLENSIVGNNLAECYQYPDTTLTAFNNVLEDPACAGESWPTNFIGDPKISGLTGALAAGRWKRTHKLLHGSPAIDAAVGDCEATDQRGTPRPIDGNSDGTKECDIGAYETSPTKFTVRRFP